MMSHATNRRIVKGVGLVLAGCVLASLPEGNLCQAAITAESVTSDLTRPVFGTAPPGDTGRLFVTDQHSGEIQIVDLTTNSVLATPFLTVPAIAQDGEQGLLGLAFDPDYATNGFFYVNYTRDTVDPGDMTVIRRYKAMGDPATTNVADAASGLDILVIDQPQSNHNGGWIGFGPNDGFLYIATGDGGGGHDNDGGHTPGIGNAQDTTENLLGKMLRIATLLLARRATTRFGPTVCATRIGPASTV